ncbi:MYG1 family protein [Luteolibacter algae]|uniref:MYG1 family protein n=1 Tax=Luteolibacter algae TaxID=454151 RepID=A0ABW5D9G1_9BACT
MSKYSEILTHPGSSHKDEFLACCLLIAVNEAPVFRREPTQEDLDNPNMAVVDVGGEHDASRGNFDHHQFPKDHPPTCSLSLVLMDLELYDDARKYCDWLEVAEWFDTRGPVETAAWLGVERELLAKLNSTVDLTLLRRFAGMSEIRPGEPMWEVMRWVGSDLIGYLKSLRERLNEIARSSEIWEIDHPTGRFRVLFLPRSENISEDASSGLARYASSLPEDQQVVAMVYPDRRGSGFALSRFNDHLGMDFTRIETEEDVHFAHVRGFVAKSSAVDLGRVRELLAKSWKPID